jgi:hypothetical protein
MVSQQPAIPKANSALQNRAEELFRGLMQTLNMPNPDAVPLSGGRMV